MLLQAVGLEKSFGSNVILSGVNLIINEKERIGIVGPNGVGKTTLLKILVGLLQPDAGTVVVNCALRYLEQGVGLESSLTVWEEMQAPFSNLAETEQRLRAIEEHISTWEGNEAELHKLTAEYAELEEEFRESGGYSFRGSIRGVLRGLGFSEEDDDRLISSLSGGQKTRLALASLLAVAPEALILDEPTNYLDMDSLSWLEKHLQSYPGSVIVVSHDRYFLDKVVSAIYDLEDAELTRYPGNYSSFIRQKAQKQEEQAREYQKYAGEKMRLEEFAARNIARASTSGRAKSALKKLGKLDPVSGPSRHNRRAAMSFRLEKQSGRHVLTCKDLSIGYGKVPVCTGISLELEKGEQVALLGPNGTGKTTLLKTITGTLEPIEGTFELGHNVQPVFVDQEQESLDPAKTVLDELWDRFPDWDEAHIRTVLGRFLFSGEAVFKPVSALSGGEKARLVLANTICRNANFLVLDEPTNHLDIFSREALEDALADYSGTMLFVSHDRYFINSCADRILELTTAGVIDYLGDYDYYLGKKQAQQSSHAGESKAKQEQAPGKDKIRFLRDKEIEKEKRRRLRRAEELEQLMEELEQELKSAQEALEEADSSDFKVYQEIGERLQQLEAQLESSVEEWVFLKEQIEKEEK